MKTIKALIVFCLLIAFTGCSMLHMQIKDDAEILAAGSFITADLAQKIKQNHPDKVANYIRYCDIVLAEVNDDQVKAYINNGIDLLIDSQISNPAYAMAVKSLKNMFEIDVDTSQIKFDSGSLRTAKALVKIFRDQLGA